MNSVYTTANAQQNARDRNPGRGIQYIPGRGIQSFDEAPLRMYSFTHEDEFDRGAFLNHVTCESVVGKGCGVVNKILLD